MEARHLFSSTNVSEIVAPTWYTLGPLVLKGNEHMLSEQDHQITSKSNTMNAYTFLY